MTKPLNTLLQKEMSRKEFLATVGFGVASVMGVSSLVQTLTGKSLVPGVLQNQSGAQSGTYGASAYGGTKNGA